MMVTTIAQAHVYNAQLHVSNVPVPTIVSYVNSLTAYTMLTHHIHNVSQHVLTPQYPLSCLLLNFYNVCLVMLDAQLVYFHHLFVPNAPIITFFITINALVCVL